MINDVKYMIFDLDGTLLNTIEDLAISTNYALEKYNYPVHTVDEVRNMVGNGVDLLIKRAMPEINNGDFDLVYEAFKEHYRLHASDHVNPYDGIKEMLQELKNRNIKIGVVTNKMDDVAQVIVEEFFPHMADVIVGQMEGLRKKPYPDMVIKAMKILNADISHSLFMGDSEVDYQTAVNSNLECISCSWGFKTKEFLKQYGSKYIIDQPNELFNYIK